MLRTTNAHMYYTASSKPEDHEVRPLADLTFMELIVQSIVVDPDDDAVFTAEALTMYETYGVMR